MSQDLIAVSRVYQKQFKVAPPLEPPQESPLTITLTLAPPLTSTSKRILLAVLYVSGSDGRTTLLSF